MGAVEDVCHYLAYGQFLLSRLSTRLNRDRH